jgi:hypothetical protein
MEFHPRNSSKHKNLMKSTKVFCPILTKFGIPQQMFIEDPNIKFHLSPYSGTRADICGQMDGQDEGNRCFS